jgi:hypothetical protein
MSSTMTTMITTMRICSRPMSSSYQITGFSSGGSSIVRPL